MKTDIASHYQQVGDAWHLIMGDCQHFGYHDKPEALKLAIADREALNKASHQLILALLDFAQLDQVKKPLDASSTILDVGCGQGGSELYLYQHCHAKLTGIALSENEIFQARKKTQALGLQDKLHFFCADGQNNGLPDKHFSHLIMLESSLLVPDKKRLFSENFRVLKPGGVFLLCDQIKQHAPSPKQMYQSGKHFEALQLCFGKTRTESLEDYHNLLQEQGFSNIRLKDVSDKVMNSPLNWKNSALRQKQKLLDLFFSEEQFQNFIDACDALYLMMQEHILGYGFVVAEKPE